MPLAFYELNFSVSGIFVAIKFAQIEFHICFSILIIARLRNKL